MAASLSTCNGCRRAVIRVVDVETSEHYLVDAEPTDGGHVDVWTAGGHAAARRHHIPSPRQPAHQMHECAVVKPPPLPDPYAQDAAAEQHGGWR